MKGFMLANSPFGPVLGQPYMAPQKELGQIGGNYCVAPDGSGSWRFDTGSGECVPMWAGVRNGKGPAPGETPCVENPKFGQKRQVKWVHPSCAQVVGAPEPSPPPPEPPIEPPPEEPPIEPPPEEPPVEPPVEPPPEEPPVEPPPEEPPPEEPPPEEPPPEEPPPAVDEEALACPTNGTYDIYDGLTGEHIASNVAAEDIPIGAEIVAVDDPRCGPVPDPGVDPGVDPGAGPGPDPGAGGPPYPGTGTEPGAGVPAVAPGVDPRGRRDAPIPTTPMPGGPGAPGVPGAPGGPAQPSFTGRFVPCGSRPPVSVRSLRTETLPSRPDSWQDQWTRI